MSTRQLPYDPFQRLGEAVIAVLERCGPSNPADIAREIRSVEGGRLQSGVISKVLADYLTGRVKRCGKNTWQLI